MKSLVDVDAPIAAFAREFKINFATCVRKISLELLTKIVRRTPVDTGRARSGWDLTVGRMSTWVPPEVKKGKKAGGARLAEGAAEAAGIDGRQIVYILNNVEYIEFLENGTSQQAPAGMVQVSMAEVAAEVELMLAKAIAAKNR